MTKAFSVTGEYDSVLNACFGSGTRSARRATGVPAGPIVPALPIIPKARSSESAAIGGPAAWLPASLPCAAPSPTALPPLGFGFELRSFCDDTFAGLGLWAGALVASGSPFARVPVPPSRL
ncbi:MAG TPA: hypothetical protein VGQ57_06490 [Polyangiaceae bacterium]|nr:hypothetical protein [Polyangiaceae bacterium]